MDETQTLRLKAFLWDQFVFRVYKFFNLQNAKGVLWGLLLISTISKYGVLSFFLLLALFLISVHEIIKYYKSGEYMKNYRDYKYPDYRKAIKELRQKRKDEKEIQN